MVTSEALLSLCPSRVSSTGSRNGQAGDQKEPRPLDASTTSESRSDTNEAVKGAS